MQKKKKTVLILTIAQKFSIVLYCTALYLNISIALYLLYRVLLTIYNVLYNIVFYLLD